MIRSFVAIIAAVALAVSGAFAQGTLTLVGVGSSGAPAAVTATYISLANDNATGNVSTYTFTSQSIGTAFADRNIVVAFHYRNDTGAAPSLSSATIGGVSATALVNYAQSANSNVGFLIATVPTGTTANVTFNWGAATVDSVGIFVYAVGNLLSTSAVATSTLAASASNPAIIPALTAATDGVQFYVNRDTGDTTNSDTVSPIPKSGSIYPGNPSACGTGTGACTSGFQLSTSTSGPAQSITHASGSVGGAQLTLR